MVDRRKTKLAVFPKGFMDELIHGDMSLFEWIEMAGTLDVEGLELYPMFLENTSKKYLSQVKNAAIKNKLEIPMMCSSPDFTHPSKTFRQKEINKMKEMIDVMAYLGPKDFRSCRVLSGQNRPEITYKEGILWTVESIKELLPYAEKMKVHLVIENHYKDGYWNYPEFALPKKNFLEIISQISSPYFGVNFDPSNALFAGEDPVDFLNEVNDRVITMHASDRFLKEGYTLDHLKNDSLKGYSEALLHGVIGKGINNYDDIFTVLQDNNDLTWISIEDGVNGLGDLVDSTYFLNHKIEKYFK